MKKVKYLWQVVIVLLGAWLLRSCGLIWNPFSRYDALKAVINRHVGHAHATRGMNMYTIAALKSKVTEKDIPLLIQMLNERDHVTQMTAAQVLATLGPQGKQVLLKVLGSTPDYRLRTSIQDALLDANSGTE
ncbi:MAG: HEAT repeat domain-containing protein [Elusimicrobia bacterium]|nr:HEAT repeat domain-containing protein [Elusimicrobiota bacterium]